MRLFHLLNLLTFVSYLIPSITLASPKSVHRPAPVKNPIKSSSVETGKPDVTKEETTQISYPENMPVVPPQSSDDTIPRPTKKFEVKASSRLINQLSFIFDSGRFIDDVNKNILIAHYTRTLLEMDDAELNLGFGLSPQNLALMHLGQKWNWRTWSTDDGAEYPLYLSFNILNYIDSSQMLAGLINVNHFKLQLVFGLEQIEFLYEKFSAEVGAAYGINGFSASVSLGWKF